MMKASELMICDWVDIREDGKHLKYTKVHDLSESREEEYYFPIPLTKEMLVNDEFYIAEEASRNAVLKKKTDDALIVVLLIGNSFVLNIERNIEFEGTYATDSVHKCGYFVHELQHALRLCGLNELADNFKLK